LPLSAKKWTLGSTPCSTNAYYVARTVAGWNALPATFEVHAVSPKAHDEELTRVLSEDTDANSVRNAALCARHSSELMRNAIDAAAKR
jgi:hypothetical protein